ncbi:MAG: ribulose-phosphate 3-epimerase [Methylacidiphilales bacterium]|nr:ribulose-phosphate 3-epimerase [Candidatus Methylacidiphilales bacterium]
MSLSHTLPFRTPALAPSILSCDLSAIASEVSQVLEAGSDIIHFDVMDNQFVPNLTFGPVVLQKLREAGVTAPIDVHLMVADVDRLLSDFIDAGATMISFHPHCSINPVNQLSIIKTSGCLAGLAINPDQPISVFEQYLPYCDFILLMSVFPGRSGQKFISSVLEKSKALRAIIKRSQKNILIEMDGGITQNTIAQAHQAGVDIFVMGNGIFTQKNLQDKNPYSAVTNTLRELLSN